VLWFQNRQHGFQNETASLIRPCDQHRNFSTSLYTTINYSRGNPVASSRVTMRSLRRSERGYSLLELMLVIAFAITAMTIAVPVLTDVSDNSKLNAAAREIEREFQSARLKSVSTNRLPIGVRPPRTHFHRRTATS
jgi:hypothetical protein